MNNRPRENAEEIASSLNNKQAKTGRAPPPMAVRKSDARRAGTEMGRRSANHNPIFAIR